LTDYVTSRKPVQYPVTVEQTAKCGNTPQQVYDIDEVKYFMVVQYSQWRKVK